MNDSTSDDIRSRYVDPQPPKNSALTAIKTIWIVALLLGFVLSLTGIFGNNPAFLIAGGALLNLAILGGLIHLAVKAVRWQSPVEPAKSDG